jgi:hypothetical protein
MKAQTREKIVTLLEGVPEKKAGSIVDFIRFLRWADDAFSEEEIALVLEAKKESRTVRGKSWRSVRNDV